MRPQFSRVVHSKFEGAVKLKFAASLIILLLAIAAVDSIPDPPATAPRTSDRSVIYGLHAHGPAALPGKQRVPAFWLLSLSSIQWISFRLDFKYDPGRACYLPLIRHATDSSPPRFL
jgi:hypothetical protein